MTNVDDVLDRLGDLKDLDKDLWGSFRIAEKEANVGVLNFRKQWVVRKAIKEHENFFVTNQPFALPFAVVMAFITVFLRGNGLYWTVCLAIYAMLVAWGAFGRQPFVLAWTKWQLNRDEVVHNGFGIDYLSLQVFRVVTSEVSGDMEINQRINTAKLDALIKVNKANIDYASSQYGFNDYVRKLLIAILVSAPLTGPATLYKYRNSLPGWLQSFTEFFAKHDALVIPSIIMSCALFLLVVTVTYSFVIEGPMIERRKKRYLLQLNILRESWVD